MVRHGCHVKYNVVPFFTENEIIKNLKCYIFKIVFGKEQLQISMSSWKMLSLKLISRDKIFRNQNECLYYKLYRRKSCGMNV